jgi:hypothetical protein
MNLYDKLVAIYPELAEDKSILRQQIELRDDSDGHGPYIEKWEYSKPLPEGMKVGKN